MLATGDEGRQWTYVSVSATPPHSEATVSEYKLAVIGETLGRAGIDPDTGELRVEVRVPESFRAETREQLARSLVRAVLYSAGVRGWTLN